MKFEFKPFGEIEYTKHYELGGTRTGRFSSKESPISELEPMIGGFLIPHEICDRFIYSLHMRRPLRERLYVENILWRVVFKTMEVSNEIVWRVKSHLRWLFGVLINKEDKYVC